MVPVLSALAVGWALIQGPREVFVLSSRTTALTDATTSQAPLLGWHAILIAIGATLFALGLISILMPYARLYVANAEFLRLRKNGADVEKAYRIAEEKGFEYGR